ncbi:hypothetical protein [Pueribacillus sp. YX66]|uniref:hypothetical protein n=1 Tax=Pueribacillus sp. YX66 TaxID=3229242 RepID=UPI00358D5FBB
MKRFSLFLLFCLIIYTSYLDLSKGTLYLNSKSEEETNIQIPYDEIVVLPGETVLSVLERINGTLPVSIEQALQDFAVINPSVDPMLIQAGKRYKFPVYKDVDKVDKGL